MVGGWRSGSTVIKASVWQSATPLLYSCYESCSASVVAMPPASGERTRTRLQCRVWQERARPSNSLVAASAALGVACTAQVVSFHRSAKVTSPPELGVYLRRGIGPGRTGRLMAWKTLSSEPELAVVCIA